MVPVATTTKSPFWNPVYFALLAYGWWGVVPIYWKHLKAFPSEELILYRVLLSSLFLLPLLLYARHRRDIGELLASRRSRYWLLLSGALIGGNWYLYVWAVIHDHVLESSLGYFLNPLVNVALGTLLLGEKMSRGQKLACGFAAAGAAVLTVASGKVPWIALALAFSFALYGLTRKILAVKTLPGTFLETLFLSLPTAVLLAWYYRAGFGHVASATGAEWALLLFSGLVTTVPLLAFAEAAKGMPLSTLGFFQFISPTLQFLLGALVYGEPFGRIQAISFGLIWVGLGIFLVDRQRSLAAPGFSAK